MSHVFAYEQAARYVAGHEKPDELREIRFVVAEDSPVKVNWRAFNTPVVISSCKVATITAGKLCQVLAREYFNEVDPLKAEVEALKDKLRAAERLSDMYAGRLQKFYDRYGSAL
jgi:hypothetical protein